MPTIIKIAYRVIKFIDRLNDWIGKSIAWLTVVMVLITFLIVTLRYVLDLGWIAMQESVFYLHTLVFMLGIAYTLKQNGHVRVDIIYQRCSEKAQAWIDLLGTLILLIPFCGYLFWISWDYVADSWSIKEKSREAGGLPGLYLVKSTMLVMAGLLIFQGLAQTLQSFIIIAGGAHPREH